MRDAPIVPTSRRRVAVSDRDYLITFWFAKKQMLVVERICSPAASCTCVTQLSLTVEKVKSILRPGASKKDRRRSLLPRDSRGRSELGANGARGRGFGWP